MLPQVVPADRLREVNAVVQLTNRGGMLLGAAVGGVLVATVGPRAALHEAREGVQVVLRRPWVTAVMLQGTVQILFAFAPMKVLLPLVAQQRYGDGAYGLLAGLHPGRHVARLLPSHAPEPPA